MSSPSLSESDKLNIAENKLKIAKDKLKIAKDELRIAYNDLQIAEDKLKIAKDELQIAEAKGDTESISMRKKYVGSAIDVVESFQKPVTSAVALVTHLTEKYIELGKQIKAPSSTSPRKSAPPKVTEFWNCLKQLEWKESDEIITLDTGIYWMGRSEVGIASLYIRTHYKNLYNLIFHGGLNQRSIILGNPGIGKVKLNKPRYLN